MTTMLLPNLLIPAGRPQLPQSFHVQHPLLIMRIKRFGKYVVVVGLAKWVKVELPAASKEMRKAITGPSKRS